VEVEIKTQTFLCGGVVAIAGFLANMAGHGSPRIYRLGNAKIAHIGRGTYTLVRCGVRFHRSMHAASTFLPPMTQSCDIFGAEFCIVLAIALC